MHFKVYYDDETAQRLTAAPEAMAEKFAAIPALTDKFARFTGRVASRASGRCTPPSSTTRTACSKTSLELDFGT